MRDMWLSIKVGMQMAIVWYQYTTGRALIIRAWGVLSLGERMSGFIHADFTNLLSIFFLVLTHRGLRLGAKT